MGGLYTIAEWASAEGVSTSEGFVSPLIATPNISLTSLEISPGDEVLPHSHSGLPYFEVILYILDGTLEVIVREERVQVKADTAIMASPDDIGWANKTDKLVKALLLHAPPPAWKSAKEFLERIRSRT